MYVSNASLNLEKQMVIPCNIFETFEIISYGKLSKFLTSPNFNSFLKDLKRSYWAYQSQDQDLKMDLERKSCCLSTSFDKCENGHHFHNL